MSAHDELLTIHTILMTPGDCPAIADDDTLTVRMLKDLIIWQRHQRKMAFGPQWNGAREVGPPPTTPQIAAMQQSQQGEIVAGKSETPN